MFKRISSSFCISVIITATLMTASFLKLLFSTKISGKYYAYFNSLFFENLPNPDGSLTLRVGLSGEYIPIIVSIFVFMLLIFLYQDYKSRSKV